ncbi:DUF4252 domain-containing protein [Parabacteroides sp. 52]|uniref:DUF4252 domain-containing protein n=1 Tax=unclassified Parabacteroides TaxID=2649774 RepID=UPI0013D7B9D4|nr:MULTISPECIES: DUF4252 domain-containing protein [unclassified Parabacteroides]MDH6534758.1 hypothetical protein [Parabacteroides sp. PM5-20]NDV55764.1 DUF4252 domain-containing protein [Parabacteroides sp. 52]
MKKYMIMLAWMIICQVGYGQKTVDDLFKEFKKMDNVTHINMGTFTMKLAGFFTETMGVDGIEVYTLDDCSTQVKEKVTKWVGQLKDSKYETMVTTNEKGSKTRVLVKIKEEIIREMVVITTGEEVALIRIKGKIKPSDIEQVVNKHGKGEC